MNKCFQYRTLQLASDVHKDRQGFLNISPAFKDFAHVSTDHKTSFKMAEISIDIVTQNVLSCRS